MSISSTPVQQVAVKTAFGGSATKTVTITAPTAGNSLRLMVWTSTAALTIGTPTGGGVTWSALGTIVNSDSTCKIFLFGGENSSGSGTTISMVFSNTYATGECSFSEWSGLDTAPVADPAAATNTGTSATITSSTVTPTAGKEVLLLACGGLGSTATVTNTPANSFTALTRTGTATLTAFAYRVVSSASGTNSTTWPASVSYRPWAAIIAGWDGASAGATIKPTYYNMLMAG